MEQKINRQEEYDKSFAIGFAEGLMIGYNKTRKRAYDRLFEYDCEKHSITVINELLAKGITWNELHIRSDYRKERFEALVAKHGNPPKDESFWHLFKTEKTLQAKDPLMEQKRAALDLRFWDRDSNQEMSIKEYLILLLKLIWEEDEDYYCCRPFCNRDWKEQVYTLLAKNGFFVPTGTYQFDEEEGKKVVMGLIEQLQ